MNEREGNEIVFDFFNRNVKSNWKESYEDLKRTIDVYGDKLDDYRKSQLFNIVSEKADKEFGNMFKIILISGIFSLIGYWYFIVYKLSLLMYKDGISNYISVGHYLIIGIVWMISFIVGFSLAVYFIRYIKNKRSEQ